MRDSRIGWPAVYDSVRTLFAKMRAIESAGVEVEWGTTLLSAVCPQESH